MRKSQSLSQAMNDKRKNSAAKFKKKPSNIPSNQTYFDFSQMRKFLPGSNGKLTEQSLALFVPTRCIDIDEKQTPSPHHDVWDDQ